MNLRIVITLVFLLSGYILSAQTSAPATSATDGDVKIHSSRRVKRQLGGAHSTERQGQSVPKQKVYKTPGTSKEGRVKQHADNSAKKKKSKRAQARRGKKL